MPPKRKAAKQVESSDDESEKTTSIFKGITFSIVGRFSKTQSALTELIEQNGGDVSKTISSDTTHVLSTQGEVDKGNTKLKDLDEGVHLVSESFLHESIKKGKKLSEEDYALSASKEESEEEEEEEEKPKKKTAKSSKKKEESEEEESEEEEKPKSKRKAATTKEKKATGKKAKGKQEEEEEEEEVEESEGLKAEKEKKNKESESASVKTVTMTKKGRAVVDVKCSVASTCHVIDQGGVIYDATLNQTDVTYGQKGHNKFYIAQALESDSGNKWYCWTRWGRVGANGQSKLDPCGSAAAAIKAFEKKFYEKTKNQWANRANFKPVKGKYDLIEMDHGNDDEEEEEEKDIEGELEKKRQARNTTSTTPSSSKLDARVQELIKLIFDLTMFEQTLMSYDIDVKKMPLGRISKNQIAKGYEILESIEELFNEDDHPSKSDLAELCNRFYTVIPHDFSFKKPPIISTLEELQNKMDLLEVLGDIEVAQNLIDKEKKQKSEENPIDAKYKVLNNSITAIDKGSDEWNRVETYLKNTKESYKLTLLDLYALNRDNEKEAFSKFDHIKERKLLWHGSKVAVFPSILSGGLKIMPHSGGRVGRGLYFADIVAKSASYCGLHNNIGLILLNEVALGKSHEITKDDPSLTKAPKGFDSVLAKGFKQVDDSEDYEDTKLSHTEHPVIIPQGKIEQKTLSSSFMHNEYLVYDSAQVSMKYLLRLKWN